jgi:hypothetical protein
MTKPNGMPIIAAMTVDAKLTFKETLTISISSESRAMISPTADKKLSSKKFIGLSQSAR